MTERRAWSPGFEREMRAVWAAEPRIDDPRWLDWYQEAAQRAEEVRKRYGWPRNPQVAG